MSLRLGLAEAGDYILETELLQALEGAALEAGISVRRVREPRDERGLETTIFLSFPRRYGRLLAAPRKSYRIAWYGENLPIRPPSRIQRLLLPVPSPRIADLAHDTVGRVAGASTRQRILRWREEAVIERSLNRNLHELEVVRRRGLIDELVVTSPNRVTGARLAGWAPRIVQFGYHRAMAGPIVPPDAGPRDIDVMVLAKGLTQRVRRHRLIDDLRRRLQPDIRLTEVSDGLYGSERQQMLARTRIILDIQRIPHSSSALRYVLATAAGVALVAEPSQDDWLPNRIDHLVEADLDDLPHAVRALTDDEERRQRLVKEGQQLLLGPMSMATSLHLLLEGRSGATPPGADAS